MSDINAKLEEMIEIGKNVTECQSEARRNTKLHVLQEWLSPQSR